jgi:hypothetical protein
MQTSVPVNYQDDYSDHMLRNVLEDYLNNINKERDLDYPLISLLRAMGFYDIHFTHGTTEIGKDFIAKKVIDDVVYQHAIQSKQGNINQQKFSSEIYPQILLASISGLSHPQFDKDLPRRVVVVTTGRLIGNAPLIFQDLNIELETKYKKEKAEFWGKEQLIQYFEEFGFASIHQFTSRGLAGYAQFYLIYSKALDGELSDREITEFSGLWLDHTIEYRKRILRAAIETEIITSKLIGNGSFYEAIILYASFARLVLQVVQEEDDEYSIEIYQELVKNRILPLCEDFFSQFKEQWEQSEKSLLYVIHDVSAFPMLHYLVWCARVTEIVSLYFFLAKDQKVKADCVSFLVEIIDKEEGCGHIPSDRYATSLVWMALILIKTGMSEKALDLVKKSVIWHCDRVDSGAGLAHFEASEFEETAMLIGHSFEFIKAPMNRHSFLATILADLAALIGDKDFYSMVVNDFEASDIAYNYWQFPDTSAIFTIETNECRAYANIDHSYTLNSFDDYEYAEHLKLEPPTFQIAEKAGLNSLILLSFFLKDRYFPKLWRRIIAEDL